MLPHASDGFTILDIGLPSRHVFDMLSVAHNELAGPFQDRIHRLPVDVGALHAYMSRNMVAGIVPLRDGPEGALGFWCCGGGDFFDADGVGPLGD